MSTQPDLGERLDTVDSQYQLVIIGGGIYGAALCWEAAHRGISTLVVEQNDYACGTSSNSLKTIHSGLRSLQSFNLSAVLNGIGERSTFFRIAPNYTEQLPCILPTTRSLMKSKLVVGMGLLLYDALCRTKAWISIDYKNVPKTRLLPDSEFLNRAPGLNPAGITGGALWYDAQVINTERLVLQFIKSAVKKGAVAINHAIAVKCNRNTPDGRKGILIRDQITGYEKTITGEVFVDCSSAWNFIKHCLPVPDRDECLTFLKSVNIIVKKKLFNNAVGANARTVQTGNSRLYFLSPWRDCTMIGTWYSAAKNLPVNDFSLDEATTCIDDINAVFSQKLLDVDDICNVHIGFLPANKKQRDKAANLDQDLLSKYHLKDWSNQLGMHDVYSFRGTKYTLARYDAKQVVDRLAKKMKWKVAKSQSHWLPIYQEAPKPAQVYSLSEEVVDHLIMNYGADIDQLFSYIKEDPLSAELIPGTQYHIMAEIYYVVFHEQALTLCDLLKRRLDTGARALPDLETVNYCARVMQRLLLWSDKAVQNQIAELYASYPDFLMRNKSIGLK